MKKYIEVCSESDFDRTVSEEAVFVAGLVPFDLLMNKSERLSKSENGHVREIRATERAVTMYI